MSKITIIVDMLAGSGFPDIRGRSLVVNDGSRRPVTAWDEDSEDPTTGYRALLTACLAALGDMREVVVQVEEFERSCDDCGCFFDEAWTVALNGETVIRFYSDGHFGGGDNLYATDALVCQTLEVLDVQAEVRKEGAYRLTLSGTCTNAEDVPWDAGLNDDYNDAMTFELDLENIDVLGPWYLAEFLRMIPLPARVVIGSAKEAHLLEVLDYIAREDLLDAATVDAVRGAIVIDSAADQAKLVPDEMLLRRIDPDFPDYSAPLPGPCDRLTFAAEILEARRRNLMPEHQWKRYTQTMGMPLRDPLVT